MLRGKRVVFGLSVLLIALIVAVPSFAYSAQDSTPAPLPSDGIDFASLLDSKSSVFLGTYDHSANATYGATGGTLTKEGTSRPILWNIVANDNGTLTLMSNYVIGTQEFATNDIDGSFGYVNSAIANTFAAGTLTNSFKAAEKSSTNLKLNDISTSIYDRATGISLGSLSTGSIAWPSTKYSQQLYLPWARTMSDLPPQTPRLYFSANGTDTTQYVSSTDIQTTLRSKIGAVPYWTRSPYLAEGASPQTNEALYVATTGQVEPANVTDTYGLRPLAALDTSRILLAEKISDGAIGSLEIDSDAQLNNGVVDTDGNYYSADSARGEASENYKLTLISEGITLQSLITADATEIDAGGSTRITTTASDPLEFYATASQASDLGYKVVRSTAGMRQIVAAGKSTGLNLDMALVGLDGQSVLPQGTYTVYVWALRQNSANSDEASVPYSFTLDIDTEAPSSTVSPKTSDKWSNANIDVSITASDSASAISELHYIVDSGQEVVLDYQDSAQISLTASGTHEVVYWAVDKAGNTEVKNKATYAIDRQAPLATALPSGIYAPQTFALSATDTDEAAPATKTSGVANIYYRIDNKAVSTYSTPFEIAQPGVHLVQYWAVDKAGNAQSPLVVQYTIKAPPEQISLSHSKITLLIGKTLKPKAVVLPAQANQELVWTSTNAKVASVTTDGLIKANKSGTATITAKTSFGSANDVINITVENNVSSIAASHRTIHLSAGKTIKLPIVAYAKDASKVTLNWQTKKYGAATIVNNNDKVLAAKGTLKAKANKTTHLKIKANKPGTAKITIKSKNNKRYTIKVVVHKKGKAAEVTKLKVSGVPKAKRLEVKKTARLKVTINPIGATNAVAKWTSTNAKVIKVDQSGKVTALKKGSATIKVKVGKKTAKVKLVSVRWKS